MIEKIEAFISNIRSPKLRTFAEKLWALCVKYREILVYLIVGVLTTIVAWGAKFLWNVIFYAGTAYPTKLQNSILSVVNWVAGVAFRLPHEPQMGFPQHQSAHSRRSGGLRRLPRRDLFPRLVCDAAAGERYARQFLRCDHHLRRARHRGQLCVFQAPGLPQEEGRLRGGRGETGVIRPALSR